MENLNVFSNPEHLKAYRQISQLSIISLLSGILSVICLMAVVIFRGDPPEDIFIAETAVIAVVTGVLALLKIRKYPKIADRSFAIIGAGCGAFILLFITSFFLVVLLKTVF